MKINNIKIQIKSNKIYRIISEQIIPNNNKMSKMKIKINCNHQDNKYKIIKNFLVNWKTIKNKNH